MQPVFLYITADTPEEATSIGRTLVEERLAACVNILGGITSFYWWEGAVQQGAETALIAKTRADLADAVTARIKQLHGYTCPCVVALPIQGGNPDFLDWIAAETGSQEGTP
jgi:periplasmic divalent cation tolerance protein